ncbi:TPA: hypothetical protein SLZ57_000298 [Vibrio cholerae]|uniref:hypothetical protein n=1 Tax=Vibrio cholerae TaxID=666 RepID=UPI000E0A2762|nr:hypothetical protein [Vibrio cholerae]EGX7706286.1 hypothetical protein [Vibrio cholerae]EID7717774.1 hypothetical protein [Vibrio cholerae]EKF9096555.1 hypothetical protein [Vibrio cholerae]HEJ2444912.1 hypothetical protein [Vibrio cholerae]
MEQIVITANQLATLIEASYFYNFVAVFSALLVYDVFRSFFVVGLTNLRAYLEKRFFKEHH